MDWDKWGLFISLVTPLILGVGALINELITRRRKTKSGPAIQQGLPVDYETDYIKLLKQNLADARGTIKELRAEVKQLRKGKDNG